MDVLAAVHLLELIWQRAADAHLLELIWQRAADAHLLKLIWQHAANPTCSSSSGSAPPMPTCSSSSGSTPPTRSSALCSTHWPSESRQRASWRTQPGRCLLWCGPSTRQLWPRVSAGLQHRQAG